VRELNAILGHMDVLAKVNAGDVDAVVGVGASGAPLRDDEGPPTPLAHPIETFAPKFENGFFLVPRLSTHESAGDDA
jgi:aspartyl-tRNA(Asn)/glutamyl-tRNA(Gln) amidotransferase subunit C